MCSSVKSLSLCYWSDAKPRLRKALGDYLPQAEKAIKRGDECCYQVGDTYLLLRGERFENHQTELVVVGLDGNMAEGTLSAVSHAIENGFDSIRAHFFKRSALRFIERKLQLPVQLVEVRDGREFVLRIRFSDMGGSSKSSSSSNTTTTTTNVSGTAATSGDNFGAMISGINNSDIQLTMTDHGALEVAKEFGEGALNLATDALQSNSDALENAFKFGESALESNTDVSTHAIDSITNMAGQQVATTKAAIDMANAAKAREQTGTNESDNKMLTNISLIVGILVAVATLYFMMKKGKA